MGAICGSRLDYISDSSQAYQSVVDAPIATFPGECAYRAFDSVTNPGWVWTWMQDHESILSQQTQAKLSVKRFGGLAIREGQRQSNVLIISQKQNNGECGLSLGSVELQTFGTTLRRDPPVVGFQS